MKNNSINSLVYGYQEMIENIDSNKKLSQRALEKFECVLKASLPTKFFARYQDSTEHVRLNDVDEIRVFETEKERDDWIKDMWDYIDGDESLYEADCRKISYDDFVRMAGKDLFDPYHYSTSNDGYHAVVFS